MKTSEKRLELESAASAIGIKVIYGKIHGLSGDKCWYKGKDYIIINRYLRETEKVNLLARFLSGFNLDDLFLLPAVRDLIDKEREK